MKRIWLLAVFYCIVHKPTGDMMVMYEGMDQAAIKKLIQQTYDSPFEFVNKTKFDAFVAAKDFKSPLRHKTQKVP